MNILFVLYGDMCTNTAGPILLFARELQKLGHECVIAIPSGQESSDESIKSLLYKDILQREGRIFSNNAHADVVHACTPRIGVVEFLIPLLSRWPTALIIYLEDNEDWIARKYLGIEEIETKLTSAQLNEVLPKMLSNPNEYPYVIALANLVILIQGNLSIEVPRFKPTRVIPWGVDQSIFHPDVTPSFKRVELLRYKKTHKLIVYHGGLNGFTYTPILDLCHAIEIINNSGTPCKLIRTGNNPINFWDQLPPNAKEYILEIGVVDREELPEILALADLYVQPGRIDPFEELRLPSKLLEFFSMGKPVIMPNVGIANILEDQVHAVLLKHGDPFEIAEACLSVFKNEAYSRALGANARIFAQKYFNLAAQTIKLEGAYKDAITLFNPLETKDLWLRLSSSGPEEAALLSADYALKDPKINLLDISNQLIVWCEKSYKRIKLMQVESKDNTQEFKSPYESKKTTALISFWKIFFSRYKS